MLLESSTPVHLSSPRAVRPILRPIRLRYHRLPVSARPALCSSSLIGLCGPSELLLLAQHGVCLSDPGVIKWLSVPPSVRRQRRRRWERRVESLVLDVLRDVLPDAVTAALEEEAVA